MSNKHTPMKQKHLRANQNRFMTKNLHKKIIKHSTLSNTLLRNRTEMSQKEYKNQRKPCVKRLKRTKKRAF